MWRSPIRPARRSPFEQLCRQQLAPGDAAELGQGRQAGVTGGTIAAADAFTTANKEAPTQAAQIQNLILQGYNAIVVNAASPEALNGAVKEACDAGIVVVAFDGLVTEPCAYKVRSIYRDYGAEQVRQVAKRLPNGGNILEVRGLAGTSIDDDITKGMKSETAKQSEFQDRGRGQRQLGPTTAQKAVATILPTCRDRCGDRPGR